MRPEFSCSTDQVWVRVTVGVSTAAGSGAARATRISSECACPSDAVPSSSKKRFACTQYREFDLGFGSVVLKNGSNLRGPATTTQFTIPTGSSCALIPTLESTT